MIDPTDTPINLIALGFIKEDVQFINMFLYFIVIYLFNINLTKIFSYLRIYNSKGGRN
ncbi:hypothetical protein LCGC14_2685120 [marine sediment metagenome]|uniref:Uncharacterized protein n=1 Tax=marine sediment metagenome TaxID=412755 RepID=A0A0F9BUW3_9ZZZZ